MATTRLLLIPLACAGCDSGDPDRTIIPGGPNVTIGTSPPITPTTVTGRICITEDLRDLEACIERTANDLVVTIDDVTAVPASDGEFRVVLPSDTSRDATILVTGPNIVPTAIPITLPVLDAIVPAIDAELFASILAANGVFLADNTGSILSTVQQRGIPLSGVTVTSTPISPFGPFFDAGTPVIWSLDGTGQRGVVLVPGLTAGTVDLSFEHIAGGLETQVAGVTVRNGGVTILDTSFPFIP